MRVKAPKFLTALALSMAIILPTQTPSLAEELSLRKRTMVIDETVKMGDLFDNAGANADVVLFNAPQPGERALLTMREVMYALHEKGIEWNERLSRKHVIVERTGLKVPMSEILDILQQRLLDEGMDESAHIRPRNKFLAVNVPVEGYDRLEIETFELDAHSGRVSSQMIVSAEGMSDKRFQVDGRIIYVTEIPTLSNHVSKTEVISERDIQWIAVESRKLRDGVVLDVDDLLGMSPTRSIRPGRPIRRQDVRLPIVIEKGARVVISFDIPGLSLTAKGKALDDGANNEVIRVQNLQSDHTITAKVISPTEVRVSTDFQTAMAQ